MERKLSHRSWEHRINRQKHVNPKVLGCHLANFVEFNQIGVGIMPDNICSVFGCEN